MYSLNYIQILFISKFLNSENVSNIMLSEKFLYEILEMEKV